jgi:DNA-binding transcriptional LysR family regulator
VLVNVFRSIQMFIAAYEERSFTGAALRENATQPGVSQHVASLEEHLGVKLFRRGRHDVQPTEAATVFYRYCHDALHALDTAREAVQALRETIDDDITIGLTQTLTELAFPHAFRKLSAQYPAIRMSIVEFAGPMVYQRVQSGHLDLAIAPASTRLTGLTYTHFATIPEVLVCAEGAPATPIAPRDIDAAKMILPPHTFSRRIHIEEYLGTHGVTCDQVIEMNSLASLSLVRRDGWNVILPLTMMWSPDDEPRAGLTIRPLADPPLALDWVVVESSKKVRSRAADLLVEALKERVDEVLECWAATPAVAA